MDIAGDTELVDANGWHDIEVFQQANRRLAQHADRPAIEWPDEDRADRDPTAIMGGVVAHETGGCAPPVLTYEQLYSLAMRPIATTWLATQLLTVATCFLAALLAIGRGDATGAAVITGFAVFFMAMAADKNIERMELVSG